MTIRCDNSRLIAGTQVLSIYAGHGILFENLPINGDQGGSPLLDDGGVNGDEIRWGPATVTGGSITVTLFEDGSFESAGGAGGFNYHWWRNGVQQADESVIIELAGQDYELTPETGVFSYTGAEVSILTNRLVTPQTGVYAYQGGAVVIDYEGGAVVYEIVPEPGVYGYAGLAVLLAADRLLTPESGANSYDGSPVILARGYSLTPVAGVHTYQGSDVGLFAGRSLTPQNGIYTYTGSPVAIDYSGVVLLLIDGYQIGYATTPVQLAYKRSDVLLSYRPDSGA